MTRAQVLTALRDAIGNTPQSTWARAHGISAAYVNDVLAGRRAPGRKVLAALGLTVSYEAVPRD
jgi:hypothetical protein